MVLSTSCARRGRADIFVKMSSDASLADAGSYGSKNARAQHVYDVLTANAALTQQGLRKYLDQHAIGYQVFWINNSILIRNASRDLVNEIAARADVAYIRGNHTMKLDVVDLPSPSPQGHRRGRVGRTEDPCPRRMGDRQHRRGRRRIERRYGRALHAYGLVNQYRGSNGDGTFTHDYNWFDPSKVCGNPSLAPCDNNAARHAHHGNDGRR